MFIFFFFIQLLYAQTPSNDDVQTIQCSHKCKPGLDSLETPCFTDGTCKYGCEYTDEEKKLYDLTDKSCTRCRVSTPEKMILKDTVQDQCV